jgi:hypothetical protein
MGTEYSLFRKQRLTQSQKNKDLKDWYKSNIDLLDNRSFAEYGNGGFESESYSGVNEFKRMRVNYELYNNIIDLRDFAYVCQPYGAESGELPADMTNRDIISGKIKALEGMEMKRPFSWKVIATNKEATTRREQEEFKRIREFVVSQIMQPIEQQLREAKMQESKGKQLSQQEQQQIEQQVQQELKAQTPKEVRTYMERKHQDPAEVQAQQLLQYLTKKLDIPRKFNKGFKHACISGKEVYWSGIMNGEPAFSVVNPLFFDYDKSPDTEFIEDGEWAVCEYRLTPSQIVAYFGKEMTIRQIDDLYSSYGQGGSGFNVASSDFSFNSNKEDEAYTIRVIHATWKSLRKIGFLKYTDANGKPQERLVDEGYKLNKEGGDITIKWEWIPDVHEGWKICLSDPVYLSMGPVAGQFKDLDNLYECKLPYIGAAYDNLNAEVTSLIDRMKPYQYYYNIVLYRIELLMASDKGKILMMNLNAIPKSAGIDIQKFMYFMESSKIGFLNPNEEGNKGADIVNMAKQIDMSMANNIQQYINFAEYLERKCGESVGITAEVVGQISANQAVSNVRQQIVQSSNILEPIFDLHNYVKRNALQRLVENAKVAYADSDKKNLHYVLDDLTRHMLSIDMGLLDSSTLGIFIANNSKAHQAKELVEQLAHAAMQNQQIDLADIIKVVRAEGIHEAEELLTNSESRRKEEKQQQAMQVEQERGKQQEKMLAAQQEARDYDRETQLIVIKEKGKIDLQKQAMMSMGFNEDKDMDKDGKPDILEILQHGRDANIQMDQQRLAREKFEHDKEIDKEKLKIEDKKLKKDIKKS